MKVDRIHPKDRRQEQHHRPGTGLFPCPGYPAAWDIKAASELSIKP